MKTNKLLSLLLAISLVFSLYLPASAAPVDELKSDTVLTEGKVGGKDGIFVEWKVSTGNTAIVTANISYAYNTDVFQIVDSSGNPVPFSTDSPPKQNTAQLTSGGSSTWNFADDLYLYESGTMGLVAFVRSAITGSYSSTEFSTLGKFFLAYKEGKSKNDVTTSTLRMATATEAGQLGQSSVVGMGDSSYAEYKSGTTDNSDTAGWAANHSFGKNFDFKRPAYSGTIAAPTVASNKGGEVVLNAAVLTPADSAAKIQYGYSNSASTAPTNWQDGTTFRRLTVGDTLYFYAKVVGTDDHAEKVSEASASVKVADKPALQGSVTIDNTNPKFGDTLKATTALDYNGESAGTLTYQWYRGDEKITDATGETYQVVAADMNKAIKVEVKNSNNSASVFSEATAPVAKAGGPAAPTGLAEVSKTDTTITVTKNAAWEYSIDEGVNWQDSNVFTGLTANTTYDKIVARVKATDTHNASANSGAISVTTAKGIANAELQANLKATHTVYNATYDGTAHPAFASISTLPTGWTSTYSRTEAGTYSSTLPMVTNVADSGKIYVKFSHEDYADVIAEYTVTVSRKDLSITAKDHTITYGEVPANNGVTITGFVEGETDAVLTGTKDYGYGSYVQYSDAGNYPIVPMNYEAANYEIIFTPGSLTVQPKEVGLTWSNHTGRKFADGLSVTAAATGTVNSDVINVTVTGGNETAVGDHTATATALTGEKEGNYKLPAAATQNYNIAKADAQTLADKTISVKHSNTAEQTVSVAGLMPTGAGDLTYAQGTPTGDTTVIETWDVAADGNVTFTLKTGADAEKTVTLPVTIQSDNYADSSVNVVVKTIAKAVPVVNAQNITVTYTGSAVPNSAIKGTAKVGETEIPGTWEFQAGEAVTNVVDSGSGKNVVFKPTDSVNYADATTTITVTINKATPTGEPAYTKITEENKTLANVAIAVGTIAPAGGSFKWVADDGTTELASTTVVEKNKGYNWIYTPADAANYDVLKGKVTPYYVAPSGGGYVPTVQKPEITIIGSGKADLSADGRTATITAAAGHELVSVVLNGKEMGKVEKLTGLKTGDKATITFKAKTDGKAEMDKMIAQKASKLTLMARSAKTAKLNIKVVVKGDLKAITDAGYTVKYKFYRSTKKSAGYKAVLTKKAPTYYNTYGKIGRASCRERVFRAV